MLQHQLDQSCWTAHRIFRQQLCITGHCHTLIALSAWHHWQQYVDPLLEQLTHPLWCVLVTCVTLFHP